MSLILLILLFALLLPSLIFGYLPGDIDRSERIDLQDAIIALRIASGITETTPADAFLTAVNEDGKVGIDEVIYILQCLARLRNNHSPVLSFIGSKTVNENEPLTFIIAASDQDNDTLLFSASPLPPGATLDSAAGTFAWTPTYLQSGTYQITFIVKDEYGGIASESVSILVNNKNAAPVLANIGNQEIDESSTLTFSISATDVDGNPLTYSALNLPDGAAFNPGTRTFSWTPTFSQSGTYQITFIAQDNYGGSASETITLIVKDKTPYFVAAEYFPLHTGDWQDFKDDYGTVRRSYVTGPRDIHGIATNERTYWDGQADYYTSDQNGVKLYGGYVISEYFTGNVYFDSPLLLVPNNATVGSTHTSQSSYALNISDHTYHVKITSTAKFLGLENVQTANRTLKDCFKGSVQLDQYIVEIGQYIPGDTVYYWFYKGVGCVKYQSGGNTYTITASSINGVNETY